MWSTIGENYKDCHDMHSVISFCETHNVWSCFTMHQALTWAWTPKQAYFHWFQREISWRHFLVGNWSSMSDATTFIPQFLRLIICIGGIIKCNVGSIILKVISASTEPLESTKKVHNSHWDPIVVFFHWCLQNWKGQ